MTTRSTRKTLCMLMLGLAIAGMLAVPGVPVHAQTIANGPYYATPSWDQTLPSNTRFIVLSNMGGNAVLDRETGLVWEKSPSTTPVIWFLADIRCDALKVGNRKGWRLPTHHELASLMDPSIPSPGPALPAGHPFQGVQADFYWSATLSEPLVAGEATAASFHPLLDFRTDNRTSDLNFMWCVRGPK